MCTTAKAEYNHMTVVCQAMYSTGFGDISPRPHVNEPGVTPSGTQRGPQLFIASCVMTSALLSDVKFTADLQNANRPDIENCTQKTKPQWTSSRTMLDNLCNLK